MTPDSNTAEFPLTSAHERTITQRSVFSERNEFDTAVLLALHRVHKVHSQMCHRQTYLYIILGIIPAFLVYRK